MNKFNLDSVDNTKEALKPHVNEMVFELDHHAFDMLKANKLNECKKLKAQADTLIENKDIFKVKQIIEQSNRLLDAILKKSN